MTRRVKTGVSLPEDIIRLLDEYMELTGARSRSKILSDAVLNFVNERLWLRTNRNIMGVLIVIYNEKRGETVKKLLDIQHEYLDNISATLHIHATHDKCLEVILIRGESTRILRLLGDMQNIVGVEYTKFVPFTEI